MKKLINNAIIKSIARLESNHKILDTPNGPFTAGQLLTESKRMALALQDQGMKEGDRVVLAAQPGVEFVQIIFATMMLRTQLAIIDPEMGRENYKNKLDQFKPKWVFLDSRIMLLQEHPILRWMYFKWKKNGLYFPVDRKINKILTGPTLPIFQKHTTLKKVLAKRIKEPYVMVDELESDGYASHDFMVTYTSGTTSMPKGVVHSVDTLWKSIQIISDLIRRDKEEIVGPQIMATHLPHFMLIGACAGIGVKLWDPTWSPRKRLEFIKSNNITTLFAPPAEYLELIKYCESKNEFLPESLSHVILGSAPVHKPFLERLAAVLSDHTRITCIYGMTENLVVCTADGREKIAYDCEGDLLGKPATDVDLLIGKDGEILLRSSQLFKNYLSQDSIGNWHKTGDLGYIDAHGNLILTGRKKEMIIRRNFNLYPALYEPTIKKIEGIEEAVYVGRYNEAEADEEVFLVVEGHEDLKEAKIRQLLERGPLSIDREAWPDRIVFMNIPRKGRQRKIDRIEVLAMIA